MKVGFIGLGNMGNPMATNVRKAGHELTIYDLRREVARNLEDECEVAKAEKCILVFCNK